METLSPEIITRILEYLPFDDRRELARVNKVFYYASIHPVFLRKEVLFFQSIDENSLICFNSFKVMLLMSERKLFNLRFRNFSFLDDSVIFTNIGKQIRSLNLDGLYVLNDTFLDYITYCTNLEKLELKEVTNLAISNKDRRPMRKLCSLTLNKIQISDKEFNQIMKVAPNLKELCILDSQITGWSQVIRRFYPLNNIVDDIFYKYNSSYIFTEPNILHHLNNFIHLKSLKLNQSSRIFYMTQPIQLEFKSLSLSFCQSFNIQPTDYKKLILILNQNVSLENLELYYIPVNLLSFVSKICNLRHLTLTYTTAMISNAHYGLDCLKSLMESLKNLKYIRTLSLSNAQKVKNIEIPIPPFPECTLKSLTSLDCSLDSTLGALTFGKNLTNLRIRNGDILTAGDLQLLFRNLTNLKHLWIDNCSVLDDDVFVHLPISNLKELNTLKIIKSNITHRCLRFITNSSLKILIFTNVSIEPCSTKLELNSFIHSLKVLSSAVPMLNQLEVRIPYNDLRIIKSSKFFEHIQAKCGLIMKTCFKRMKKYEILLAE